MMTVFLIAAFIIPLLIIGAIVFFVLRRMDAQTSAAHTRAEEYRVREQRAIWASATIISARRASVSEDARGKEKVDLSLQVQPRGGDSYSAHAAWYVDLNAIAQLRAGETVSIKIDASDPKVIYPNMTEMEYWIWS